MDRTGKIGTGVVKLMHVNESYSRYLIRTIPVGITFVDRNGRFVLVNPAFCSLLEYTESELLEKTWMSVTDENGSSQDRSDDDALIDGTSDAYTRNKRYITKHGRTVHVCIHVAACRASNGEFVHFITYILPIENPDSGKPEKAFSRENSNTTFCARDERRKSDYRIEDDLMIFMKRNWKWILTIVAGALAVLIPVYVDFRINQGDVQRNSEQLKELIQEFKKNQNEMKSLILSVTENPT